MKKKDILGILGNEDGSVLVVALVMLVLLTIIGISASTTSTIEIQIAGNEKIYKQNFFRAEGGAMDGVQTLENTPTPLTDLAQLDCLSSMDPCVLLAEPTDAEIRDNNFPANRTQSLDANSNFFAYQVGPAKASSIAMSKSKIFEYEIYGRSNQTNGQVVIAVGYRKAF